MRFVSGLLLLACLGCTLVAVACSLEDDPDEVVPVPVLVLAPGTLPDGTQGAMYLQTLTASGSIDPLTWSLAAGGLPPGLSLDTSSSAASTIITGTPTTPGNFSFIVLVTDGLLSAAATFNINVQPAAGGTLVVTTLSLPTALIGTPYSLPLQTSGAVGPATWSLVSGVLSPGILLSTAGVISGTPTVTGDWSFTIEVDDGSTTAMRVYTLRVEGIAGSPSLEQQLRQIVQQQGLTGFGPQHLPTLNLDQVELGRLLFFDKILSGTQDVACATCHHPSLSTGDALNLSIGVGGTGGIGVGRSHPTSVFIPRNAQPIFNIGLFPEVFWDKRVSRQALQTQTQTPDGPVSLLPDEAQALFPLVDVEEMRGTGHSLDGLSDPAYRAALITRLQGHTEYVNRFNTAFGAGQMNVDNMVRAIAQFERSQTFINAPWDRYLRGDSNALTDSQKRGAILFFGVAQCSNCHSGPLFTDFSAHNLGIPQFGPGKGNGASGREDFGLENVTGNSAHRFQFRVPSLRNVAFTGPYMHNGAFTTLNEVMLHYKEKDLSTNAYTGAAMVQAAALVPTLLPTGPVLAAPSTLFLQVPNTLQNGNRLDLESFLHALTDPAAINRRQEVPASVPSGLPVD